MSKITADNITIIDLADQPKLVATVVERIMGEWPDNRDLEAVKRRLYGDGRKDTLPSALVALAGDYPIGFISLVLWEKGITVGRPHWVDALYVEPEYRKRGVGSKLLQAGELKARALGLKELFALTDISELYLRHGWSAVQNTEPSRKKDVVMHKVILV